MNVDTAIRFGVASASADVLLPKSLGSADAPSPTAGGNKLLLLDQMHTEEDDETADVIEDVVSM